MAATTLKTVEYAWPMVIGPTTVTNDIGTTPDIAGDLTLVTAASGIFDWTYDPDDVADAGQYSVQFTATYADATLERTLTEAWKVAAAL